MTIYSVAPRSIGGVESLARELSLQLGRLGWHSVLCFSAQPPEEVLRFLALSNVTVEVLDGFGSWKWSVLRNYVALLRKHRPQILHLQFVGVISPYGWLGRLCSVRHIYVTDQASFPEGYVPRPAALWKRLVGRTVSWPLSRVICITDYCARCCIVRGFVAPDRVARIYNAVDPARDAGDGAAFRRKHAIPEDRLLVLQVSWIIPDKGISDLLDAARLVVAQRPDAHFVLVGEGKYRREYMERAGQMGLAGKITWTGQLSDVFGEGAYRAADVVCQLSRWQEALAG